MISLIIVSFMASAPAPVTHPDDLPVANPVYAGVSITDADAGVSVDDAVVAHSSEDAHENTAPRPLMPLVSINTDPLDMNWSSVMNFSDPTLRIPIISLPFMEDYGIDNIEVKLRLLNLQF